MKIISTIKSVPGTIGLAWSSFVLKHPRGYLMTTALIGVVSLILLFVPEASAQLETQVTDALNPLARLLVGPVAKGLAIIGLFAFVGLLYAGRWMMAVSSLVAAVFFLMFGDILTGNFQRP